MSPPYVFFYYHRHTNRVITYINIQVTTGKWGSSSGSNKKLFLSVYHYAQLSEKIQDCVIGLYLSEPQQTAEKKQTHVTKSTNMYQEMYLCKKDFGLFYNLFDTVLCNKCPYVNNKVLLSGIMCVYKIITCCL